ncbi:unnamed protein product [Notodromas monacha]|uniref:Uncharacterized protein n=1 Tax=Notodromas monacha TaxID=399045 RepID=A0A7R9GH98_9CRUS|nr:unnamed protein product [Notodromas monacha]CAG0922551.1 unnamed protein product [Notodromas monacha]
MQTKSFALVLVVFIGITLAQNSKPSGQISQFGRSNAGESQQKNCPSAEEVKFCRDVVQKIKSGICEPQNDNLVKSGSRQKSTGSSSSSENKWEGNNAGATAAPNNNTELQDDLSFGEDTEDSLFDGSLNDVLFDAVNSQDGKRRESWNSTSSASSGNGIGRPKPQRRPNFSLLPNGTWVKVSKTEAEPVKIRPYY